MKLTIAVSGINAIDNPGPGTGIARCLRECGTDVRIVGLAYDAMEPGIYMDWLIDKTYLMPFPSSSSDDVLRRLDHIHRQDHLDIIIPALDVEIPVYLKLERELAKRNIRCMLPDRTSLRDRSKDRLCAFASSLGLLTPQTIACGDIHGLENACGRIGFPVVVKGQYYEAVKAVTSEEALRAYNDISARWGTPVLVQKFITGDEYNLAGLGDAGKDLGMVAVKKMMITKLGKVWTNVTVRNERIFEAARLMLAALKWRGGYELEFILEQKSNELYLIEINPRFPAWIYLTAACGVNLPERMVCVLSGMPLEAAVPYKPGKVMIRYTGELIRDIKDLEKLATVAES